MVRGRPKGADGTRKAIVEAAMRGFAEKGFAATATRGSRRWREFGRCLDRYHFGGKEGLRLAAPSRSSS